MGDIGPMELVLLGLLAMLIFGPKKLPEIGRSLGKSIREFKESVGGMHEVHEIVNTAGELRNATKPANLAGALVPGIREARETAAAVTGKPPAPPAE